MSTIANLLKQSRAAHLRYYQHHQVWNGKQWVHGDLAEARKALEEARDTREQAHTADPDHTDAEWRNDKAPHAELMRFYLGRLASADL